MVDIQIHCLALKNKKKRKANIHSVTNMYVRIHGLISICYVQEQQKGQG